MKFSKTITHELLAFLHLKLILKDFLIWKYLKIADRKMITTIKIGLFLGLFLFFLTLYSYSQVSINTDGSQPDSSSVLDIKSTTKGMLIPRMSSSQRNAISTPATGLLVYDNDSHNFWYYNGFGWIELSRKIQSDWNETNDSLADYIKNKPAI